MSTTPGSHVDVDFRKVRNGERGIEPKAHRQKVLIQLEKVEVIRDNDNKEELEQIEAAS